MYSIKYSKNIVISLKSFIQSYKNSFINLIKGGGLDFEDEIIQNYISIGNKLYENIKINIEKTLESEIVFGRSMKKTEKCVIININNFKLFVYYSENLDLMERKVINLEFHKK